MPNLNELMQAQQPVQHKAANLMASLGRGGDSEIGHLTPGEFVIPRVVLDTDPQVMAAIIKAFNKASERTGQSMDWRRWMVGEPQNSVNPTTGAPEFKGASPGGSAGPSGADRSGTRESDFSDAFSSGLSHSPAFSPDDRSTRSRGFSSDPAGPTGGAEASQQDSFLSLQDEADIIGAALTPGIAQIANAVLGELTGTPGVPGDPQGARNEGGRGRPMKRQVTPVTAEAAPQRFMRPNAVGIPSGLNLSPAMSNIQQRSAIATGATQGSSVYRSQDASDYYRNLLQRALIGDDGSLGDFSSVLPVESQYLRSILGLSYQPTTSSLLEAIAAS